jgi:hypothetical protein
MLVRRSAEEVARMDFKKRNKIFHCTMHNQRNVNLGINNIQHR